MNIVITGASSGIGYYTSLLLSDQGHQVIAISRNAKKLSMLKAEVGKRKPGSKLIIVTGDISDEDSLAKITGEIKSQIGEVHVLINNAGILVNKSFQELTSKDWSNSYSTNVFGVVNMIRALLPMMNAGSHIVNISSMGGFQGSVKFKGLSAYSSGKAAVANLTECLAEEFKDLKIAVNCLCLGSVQTAMFSAAFPTMKASRSAKEISRYIAEFAIGGQNYFNGKIIPVSNST